MNINYKTMKVSTIIVNYNTKDLLKQCLESILKKVIDIDYEVIVVDNASIDGSEVFIKSLFPSVVWSNAGGNLGFGRANNLGAKHAQGEYLFLLNSDTILENNAIKIFYDYMLTHKSEKIGAIGCYLLDAEGKVNLSGGVFPSPYSEIKYLYDRIFVKNKDRNLNIDYITGADLFISKRIFDKTGGFDPNIFMYYEETDIQLRINQMGYINRLIQGPRIVHLEGGSFGSNILSFNRFMMSQRSFNYYIRKHYKGLDYIIFRLTMIFIRLTILAKPWSFAERIKAYSLVIKG